MTASVGQAAGLVVALGAASVAIIAPAGRVRLAALDLALVIAAILIVGQVADTPRLATLRDHPALAVLAAAGVLAAVAALAGAFARWEWGFPLAAFAVIAIRVPVQLGGASSSLLVPLYLVVAAAAAASSWTELREQQDARRDPPAVTWLRRALAATLALYALQALYSADVANAVENAAFFLVPFAALFVLLADVRWTPELLRALAVTMALVAGVFAAIAIVEYAARDLLLNQDLRQENAIHLYYRVNSLFRDPNILGRYLALALVAIGGLLAWERRARTVAAATALAGILLAALAFSFSLTSFAALLAGLLVLTWLRFGLRWGATALVAMAIAAGGFLWLSGTGSTDLGSGQRLDTTLSGRVDLVGGGIRLARDRPVWGWGSGSFGAAFSRHIERAKTTASHDEPITVAAEQGLLGLAVYVSLIVAALAVLLGGAVRASPPRALIAACFVAVTVHSLGYASFTTDPITWALVALGTALAAVPAVASRPAP